MVQTSGQPTSLPPMAWGDGPDSVDLYRNKHNPQPLGVVRKDSPQERRISVDTDKMGVPNFTPPI